ncbi:S9 family peptidase [Allonocardiopsis opalescens]|uniref:Dipeptidyl aminopeptidase/acylaminoacyl peptidase n=1 Tax=Allonocardiopsis opalescens TaxID=1144618 RepID=A0A2T0PUF6_9ACTN|nr:S9 family peptidase [Allonocardiopsis opalescens]PRX92438.1 dipeptidyl aminopeptidase/acylaminoacyl peptidase [Allonocardiopsis opalescens]
MGRPLHELDRFVELPRIGGLAVSPDGTRLVATVTTIAPERTSHRTSLWEIDPEGRHPARRLTYSAKGESGPAFRPDGSVLFASGRADSERRPDEAGEGAAGSALWELPARGGEARRLAEPPGGVSGIVVAREAGSVLFASAAHPRSGDTDAERAWRKSRAEAGVTAILHESHPVRYWDHDLGDSMPRLFLAETGPGGETSAPRDLTPDAGRALRHESGYDISPDGRTVVAGWQAEDGRGGVYVELVAIDTATGERRTLFSRPRHHIHAPAFSPDGRHIAGVLDFDGEQDRICTLTLQLFDTATGESRDLLAGHELWPREHAWSHDGAAVYFAADDNGRRPVFAVDLATGELRRLTGDHGAYSSLTVAPDGALYALRDAVDAPPAPVRIDTGATDGRPAPLPGPTPELDLPGTLTEIETTADDGTRVRAWLVLPEGAEQTPAPLLVWVHGGPFMSWNGWSWRWNPWLMAARGYAVLLPDPALSTGYGHRMVERGWKGWGPRTHADIMAATDAAVARDDIDAGRTALMGGSFGGYMANWVAGHTDRFRAIVTHASLWALDQFGPTTDHPGFWVSQFGDPATEPERYLADSPHLHAGKISTPMLVIHGDRDYRVPIGEALRLWWDLVSNAVDAKFLYYPDEGHWVLRPGNVKVWYQTVFAFLDHHVNGADWHRPDLV